MIKFRHLLFVAILSVLAYACGSSSSSDEDFDFAAQSIVDNDTLTKLLKAYYFDDSVDSIKPLVAGKTSLFNDTRLKSEVVTENETDYTLYYFVQNEGTPDPVKGFPTSVDSVLVRYQGLSIIRTDSLRVFETKNINPSWEPLIGTIRGWAYGFQHYKGGKNITGNGPITYENFGEGILFIPSGLAYRNAAQGANIPANTSLIFYVDLFDNTVDTDHDNDSVPSIYEDANANGDPRDDDTDGDGIANLADPDDDNDGKLTKDEDANGDGDPRNDFSDPDNPSLPDYLNPNF